MRIFEELCRDWNASHWHDTIDIIDIENLGTASRLV